MSEKLAKPSVAIVQSFLVILLTYLLSAVRETEIVSTTAIVLYILHYFVFYISDYG
ncbi:sugar transferase, partial [Streptococcus pneumoniae]|nr:sugar transferase [Streptococcus pneumoniae]